MKKIKTKGRKWTVKRPMNGPKFCVACHKPSASITKAKEILEKNFDVSGALAEVVLKSTPCVVLRDLSQEDATAFVGKLRGAGEFRVWLESATSRLKQMNLKPREEDEAEEEK